MLFANVALPIPLTQTFDYLLPMYANAVVGGRVRVPFKQRQVIGIVTAINEYSETNRNKLKTIHEVLDNQSLFSDSLWRSLMWAINYYHYPIGKALFHAIPLLLRQGKSTQIMSLYQWVATEKGLNTLPDRLKRAPKQREALMALLHGPVYCYKINELHLEHSSFHTLRSKGLCNLHACPMNHHDWRDKFHINDKKLLLSSEQHSAINAIRSEDEKFSTWLLFGITGSGKTEVYLTVLENILARGKQALILVPEINLMPQTIVRFRERFNVPVDVLHSGLNNKERMIVWLKARQCKNAIVIGTRSALFAPLTQLGIIIIDEEHDSSYKQNKGWRYHARDLAVFRAREENVPIILGTATPALETLHNVNKKKYQQLTLSKRAGNSRPVNQQLLDLKGQPLVNGLSLILLKKIHQHLENDNQVILFLNRRGFAPILLCHQCSWIAKCKRCDYYYTFHQNSQQIRCHHCNNYSPLPHYCLQCRSNQLLTIGLGTEQLEKIMMLKFPNVPITRIDRDTTVRKGALENYLSKVQCGGARILIGTQMLAKGHHFPDVTLVSLIDVDSALFSEDFRAFENFAQLYTQVSGRAGRSGKQGEVFLQTHCPKHPMFWTLLHKGYMDFAQQTLKERHQTRLPPFSNHILFRAKDHDNIQAKLFLDQLQKLLNTSPFRDDELWLMGPIPAIISKRDGYFRWQLLLSHSSRAKLQKLISVNFPLVFKLSQARKVRWSIDVDPIDN